MTNFRSETAERPYVPKDVAYTFQKGGSIYVPKDVAYTYQRI